MATFLKDCNDSKGRLMIFDHHSNHTNDYPRNGGNPEHRLEDFDHFGEGDLPRDGYHTKKGGHHRDGGHPRDGGCLRDLYYPKGWLLNIWSVES